MQTPLREYQRQAFDKADVHSTLVVLPTGAGKTLIAAAAAATAVARSGMPVLFLAPTVLIVRQQAPALHAETGLRTYAFYGERRPPSRSEFDVLVATPAAFSALSEREAASFGPQAFSLLVFDEVHHVVKKHPYRTIALALQRMPSETRPRVLGLSASLTYAVGDGVLLRSSCVLYVLLTATSAALGARALCTWRGSEKPHKKYRVRRSRTLAAVSPLAGWVQRASRAR